MGTTRLFALPLVMAASVFGACDQKPAAAPQYFERVIQPILTTNCEFSGGGACHKDDGTGTSAGNLDVSSYAQITKRRDVLRTYASYPVPLLLLKATGPSVPPIPYEGSTDGQPIYMTSEIEHVAGNTLSATSSAFFVLQKWMADGANEDGSVTVAVGNTPTGACTSDTSTRPDVVAQLASVDVSSATFKQFASDVEPILAKSCAFATCHSGPQSDFFIACQGDGTNDLSKFNYLEATSLIATAPDQSEILLKPLAPSAGGISHTGGVFFQSKDDPQWTKLYNWVVANGPPAALTTLSDGQKFFYDAVLPLFMRRGCTLEGCHSPGAANDFKLRSGNAGFLTAFSLDTDYKVARNDFLVPELPDVRQSRIAKKPVRSIAEGGYGIVHRGGPPLETNAPNTDPTMCPSPWTAASSGFCTVVEWHRIERQDLLTAGTVDAMATGDSLPIIAVSRPPDTDRAIDFDTYRPGADLVMVKASLGTLGSPDLAGATSAGSLLANCPGTTATRDVRGPDVRYDASRVAFAMRTSATDTLDIYEVTLDAAQTCTKVTDGNGMSKNGLLLHNLDPMYAPDNTLVFASTRGGVAGPTRSLKYLLPQTDLWRMTYANGTYAAPTQMTSFLGSELNPAMMLNGQMTFTAEKATGDFYQLSGRRINWDLTDYHPLLAQRQTSPAMSGDPQPSIGYQQATDIRELSDRNFAVILSDDGTKGAGGTLVTFSRSVGPFQANRDQVTFLKSVTPYDTAATGRAGATVGAYRGPYGLPDGRILVSYAPAVTNLATASATDLRYDVVGISPVDGSRISVAGLSGGANSYVDAVVVYKREPRPLFDNVTQLVFGGHVDPTDPTHGYVHFPDLPLLGTLLGANLRTGRLGDNFAKFDTSTQVVMYQHQAPPADMNAAMAGLTGSQMVYDQVTKLGSAPLASDRSVQMRLPSLTPLILELQDASGNSIFRMSEEDQFGPGEHISRGVPRAFFNSVCGGCHGSLSGMDLDIAIDPDALTGASVSLSRDVSTAVSIGN